MHWLSSPKVRLALIVNGIYFISLLTGPSPTARPNFFAQARKSITNRPASHGPSDYVPLAPPSVPRRVNAFNSGGRLYVTLNDDLALVKTPGRTLLFSPSFSVRTDLDNEPGWVTLRFTVLANRQPCPDDCMLVITANNARVWPQLGRGEQRWPWTDWTRGSVPHTVTTLDDGRVIETLAADSLSMQLPYDLFLKMISARQVRITLGTDKVELNADQIEVLREMHRQLPQPPIPDDSVSH